MDFSLVLMACVIVAVLAALGYFVFMQVQNSQAPMPGKKEGADKPSRTVSKKSRAPALPPFRSTSIRPGKGACAAALELVDQRFLVEDGSIPPLPLAECDAKSCTCKYTKHTDRREDELEDRRDIVGINRNMGALDRDDERRTGRERRKPTKLEWRDR